MRTLLLALLGLGVPIGGQTLGTPSTLPGDVATILSTGVQSEVALAAGSSGYLAVWEDQRSNLSGTINSPGAVGAGNMLDIYGARFDASGALIDRTPILIANQGMNQTDPAVAWNGTNWLVIWVTQRPDWYFFQDIVGVRVAPDGTVLDAVPIPIRPEGPPSNNYGENPSVSSDGTNWLVVWEAIDFTDNKAIVQGARVGPDGSLLDPNYRTLYKFNSLVFGPEYPQAASIAGEYMVVWDNFGAVRARRFDAGLTPLGASFAIPGLNDNTRISAGNGRYLVLANLKAVRLSASGIRLDPTPIQIPNAAPVIVQGASVRWPELAWNGTDWAVTYSISATGSLFDDPDIWLVRVDPSGAVLDPTPVLVDGSPDSDLQPVVAGGGAGDFLVTYTSRGDVGVRREEIHAARVAAGTTPDPPQGVSLGLHRQENLSWVRGPGVQLALFTSRSSGETRILAQRFDDAGSPIDPAPTLVHQGTETLVYEPSGAWNGTHFLVAWLDATGLILTRRLTPDLQVIGFGPTPVMQFMEGRPEVGALGNNFLVVVSDLFSGNKRWIMGIRVDGSTGAPIESQPFVIGFDFGFDPVVEGLGENWLVAWSSRPCHDCPTVSVLGRRVTPSGVPIGAPFVVNGPGEGISPSIAVAGDRALIAYEDEGVFLQDGIEGRLMLMDGSFLGGEISIADPADRQMFPSAGFDGSQFVVAWSDLRTHSGVEQPRADIYAARVSVDGVLLDPGGGVPVATGELPEDYPAVTSGTARTLIGYLALEGDMGVPEVQRIHYRTFDPDFVCQEDIGFSGPGNPVLSICGQPLVGNGTADLLLDSSLPNSLAFLAYGTSFQPTSLLGGTLVPLPPARVLTLMTDATGDLRINGIGGNGTPFTVYVQAVVADPSQAAGFQISNAVKVVSTP